MQSVRAWLATVSMVLSGAALACRSEALPPQSVIPTVVAADAVREQWRAAEQVLQSRCTVCHGCYDAPCQLKLGVYEGIVRGATPAPVFDPSRLTAAEPTRLFVDATTLQGWRDKAFHPVIPEGDQGDPEQSLLLRLLDLKRQHPLTDNVLAMPGAIDVGVTRKQTCPTSEEFDAFAKEQPYAGMPYGLVGLTDREHDILVDWVRAGAPGPVRAAPSAQLRASIERWESFFNENSLERQLVARYLYEHLFFASLYFPLVDDTAFFRLVRSKTAPGLPVEEIATRRPIDAPMTERFYYRLVPRLEARLDKQQMVYALDDARWRDFHEWFVDSDFRVEALPSYELEVAANPFRAFEDLPVASRYRFMLEEAHYTLMGFIKGPVCHGQTALNVIRDRFWVTFVDPDVSWFDKQAEFLASQKAHLDLPAEEGSNSLMLGWLSLAEKHEAFLQARAKLLSEQIERGNPISLEWIWDGGGTNDNTALTVFRHFDSASVEKGLLGGPPKTAWVIDYTLLEQIHYLLVAGFDVFGNVGHQVSTRLYMDFLRMEGEHNFLLLLPQKRRKQLVEAWYRDVDQEVKEKVYGQLTSVPHEPALKYATDSPELELFAALERYLSKVRAKASSLEHVPSNTVRALLKRLDGIDGRAASFMPETSFVCLRAADGECTHVTISRDSALSNVSHLFNERDRRLPTEDQLTVSFGLLGSYPNVLFAFDTSALAEFVAAVAAMESEADFRTLRRFYAMSRVNPEFWSFSDRLHRDHARLEPLEHGWFDFNRLQAY